jgi:hypothetical protein
MHVRLLFAFFGAMLWGGAASASSMCGIVGAWFAVDDPGVITFMRDGKYFLAQAGTGGAIGIPDATGQPGMERGTFAINPTTAAFTVSVIRDTNGDWGLSHSGAMTMTVNGNSLIHTDSPAPGPITLTRVTSTTNPIVGSWYFDDGTDFAVITFTADGKYLFAQDGPPSGGGNPGMEYGTYTWNPATGAFTSTTVVNTDGEWGLSNGYPAVITVEGNTMTFSDDNSVFKRVVPVNGCSRKDFDGDGRADVPWRHQGTGASGDNYLYPMAGTAIKPNEGYLRNVADMNWHFAARADFNGDGKADILWRNLLTGENYIYLMNGTTIVGEGYIRTVADQRWRVEAAADFNGDHKADILWRNTSTGETYIYFMDGLTISAEGYVRTVADTDWKIEKASDLDGDGNADIIWRHAVTGQNYVYPMDGLNIKPTEGYLRTVPDLNWQIDVTGDFDGDGRSDIFWRNYSTGENYMYLMSGTTIRGEGYVRTVADTNWHVVEGGDFDGDGKQDLFWRNYSTGQNYIYPMDGLTIKPVEGYVRTVADTRWTVVPAPIPDAIVRINEVNANVANSCDLVELRVVSGGRINGMTLKAGTTAIFNFSAFNVLVNDIIVVHLNATSPTCNPAGGRPNETLSKTQFPAASYASHYDSAYDWWSNAGGLANTSLALTLEDRNGKIIDAVLLSDATSAPSATTETQATTVGNAGEWYMEAGGVPPGGFTGASFVANAVYDLNGTGTTAAGISIQRKDNSDANTRADWNSGPAPQTFGVLNAGQSPF